MYRLALVAVLLVLAVLAVTASAVNMTLSLNVTSTSVTTQPDITTSLQVTTVSVETRPRVYNIYTASVDVAVPSTMPLSALVSVSAIPRISHEQLFSAVKSVYAYVAGNVTLFAVKAPLYIFPWRNNTYRLLILGLAPYCTSAILELADLCRVEIISNMTPRVVYEKPWVRCFVKYVGTYRGGVLYDFIFQIRNWSAPRTIQIVLTGVNFCYEQYIGNITSTSSLTAELLNETYIASVEAPRTVRPGEKIRFRVRVLFVNTTVPAYRELVFCNATAVGYTDPEGYVVFEMPAPLLPGTYTYLIYGAHSVNTYIVKITVPAKPKFRVPIELLVYGAIAFIITLLAALVAAAYLRRRRAEEATPSFVSASTPETYI